MRHRLPLAAAGIAALLLTATAAGPLGAGLIDPNGELRQCITVGHIRAETAETDVSLLFHADGSRVFRNHLPQPCEHLMLINNVDTLKLHSRGERLCRGDTVEVIDHGGIIGSVDGGHREEIGCKLGGFEPTTEMMVTEQLRR